MKAALNVEQIAEKEKAEIVKWLREIGVSFVNFSPKAEIEICKKIGLIEE